MSLPNELLPVGLLGTGAAGGYQIERSLRFNSSDSSYLSRTPASVGNRKTWTWSGWVKRSALSYGLFEAGSTNNITFVGFNTDSLMVQDFQSGVVNWTWTTSAVFRDFSAWYHIVIAYDTTQASSANAVKIYVNGAEQAATFSTNSSGAYSQNRDSYVNSTSAHRISTYNGVSNFGDMYLADIHFIDGQALDPTSFTETDATTGQLIPKQYTGSFGTNGFWLKFSDNSAATATTLGKDYSGNSNNWTPNNLSVTAGAGNDSLVDTPTSYGTDTGAGGEVRGNYATLNPLNANGSTLSNGNLTVVTSTISGGGRFSGTIAVSSGKWYWEVVASAISSDLLVGIAKSDERLSNEAGFSAGSYSYWSSNGQKYNNSSGSSYGATWTTGDVIGIAFDAGTGTLVFYKNGVSQGTAFTGLSGEFIPIFSPANATGSTTANVNFGQRPFAYTAPSGYKALCTTNLPAPVIAQPSTVMDVKLYTGNNSTQTISGLGFSPDLVWIKGRYPLTTQATLNHSLFDQIRGAQKWISSNSSGAEQTSAGSSLDAFTSDGFTVSSSAGDYLTNGDADYVAWCWDAGSSTVTNTDGTITSQVRANASAGFSIVTYTGTGTDATIGHGLGVAPTFYMIKRRDNSSFWYVYTTVIDGSVDYSALNGTFAFFNATGNDATLPTSSVFSLDVNADKNANGGTYVAYCFTPVADCSAFGTYTGNGSADGPFVYLGFRPAVVLVKRSSGGSGSAMNWVMFDYQRNGYNVNNNLLFPNLANSENTGVTGDQLDLTSNGFKMRNTNFNVNASTYIYAAWAQNPFQYARAR